MPRACAPASVAARSAACAGIASASRDTALASSAALRISWNRSSRLLLAAPSVPRATLIPAFSSAATGANPLASLRLEDGQWTTEQPCRESSWISSADVNRVNGDEVRSEQPEPAQALDRPHPVL